MDIVRDKRKEPIRLEGKEVVLEEIEPRHFHYVIEWRNNKELNRYLNHPCDLTMETQTKWYETRYLNDDTQGFFVMVDKRTEKAFGTFGYTDMDTSGNKCIDLIY